MQSLKRFLIIVILILLALAIGYGWGYLKLRKAEQEWAVTKSEMQTRINSLEKELGQAKARESLREMSNGLWQVTAHLSDRNFGLGIKILDQLKETFLAIQPALDEDWKAKLSFFLPALEEVRKDAENLSLNAKKKSEDLKIRFEHALRSAKVA